MEIEQYVETGEHSFYGKIPIRSDRAAGTLSAEIIAAHRLAVVHATCLTYVPLIRVGDLRSQPMQKRYGCKQKGGFALGTPARTTI